MLGIIRTHRPGSAPATTGFTDIRKGRLRDDSSETHCQRLGAGAYRCHLSGHGRRAGPHACAIRAGAAVPRRDRHHRGSLARTQPDSRQHRLTGRFCRDADGLPRSPARGYRQCGAQTRWQAGSPRTGRSTNQRPFPVLAAGTERRRSPLVQGIHRPAGAQRQAHARGAGGEHRTSQAGCQCSACASRAGSNPRTGPCNQQACRQQTGGQGRSEQA